MRDLEPIGSDTVLRFGRFELHPQRRLLLDGDRPLPIGARALDILLVLVESAGKIVSKEAIIAQVRQTLQNIKAVLLEAGAGPEHITRMTWYLIDKREYLARGREVGQAYREVLGQEYGIAMSAVQVAGLMEDRAKVEIEVTAVLPQPPQ